MTQSQYFVYDWDELIVNRTHGSTFLAKAFLQLYLNSPDEKNTEKFGETFSDMQIIQKIIDEISQSQDKKETATHLLEILNTANQRIAAKIKNIIPSGSRVLTISHSEVLKEVLQKRSDLSIYCWKSPPGDEGEVLAEELNGTIVDDYFSILDIIDFLLLGCDQYNETYIVNKVGSERLIKEARNKGVSVFLLTSTLKYTDVFGDVRSGILEKFERDDIEIITEN